MNVLIFVMTMLMLLSVMTYARLQTFRNSQAFQKIFQHYMEEDERGYFNSRAQIIYENDMKVSSSTQKGKNGSKIKASPRIGIALLFDPLRDSKGKEWEQTKILFKNLADTLYDKQPFYEQIKKDRPSFLEDLIGTITQMIDELSPKERPKKAVGLANLKLKDPVLDKVLYKMLHGASYIKPVAETERKKAKEKNNEEKDAEASEDEETISTEAEEYKSPKGYYSLLDFVTASSKPNIRVYLASKEVLASIFHDPNTVNAIIEERQRLYHQIHSGSGDADQLKELFKNQFQKTKDPAIDDETLDFSISKTNPKYYQ